MLLAGISAYAAAQLSLAHMGWQIGGILALPLVSLFGLRPLINRVLAAMPIREGELPPNLMTIVLCLIFALGICTYFLGIFTIFGGFLCGLLFHHNKAFVEAWHRQAGRFVLVFFLPVFFTFTGLRTNVLGLVSAQDWMWLGIALAAAIGGKVIPVYLAGRLSGLLTTMSRRFWAR